jgi:galactoside O-acetyltransferase
MNRNQLNPGFYGSEELRELGFAKVGENVHIARNITVIGPSNIFLGNNIRIDGDTVINANTGFLKIDNYVHIGGGSFLSCAGGIHFCNYAGISQGVKIYSISDDYSGEFMTNPLVPKAFTNAKVGPVTLFEHVIVGSSSVILPNCELHEGVAVGALSLVNKSLPAWGIYSGTPAKFLRKRSMNLLMKQEILESETNN